MFRKKDQDLLAEAYNSIHGGKDWVGEYKSVAETIYTNLNNASNVRLFNNMFQRPKYLEAALSQVQDQARAEGYVDLQNDPLFGKMAGMIYSLANNKNDNVVDEFFESEKPKVQNLNAKLSEIYNYVDRLNTKKSQADYQAKKQERQNTSQ